jgi:catalase
MPEGGDRGSRYERYDGGSPEAERLVFERLAREIVEVQRQNQRAAGAPAVERAFHAKALAATENARLRFHDDLPESLRVGFARAGAEYPAIVRFSNASGMLQRDGIPDLRGVAVRVNVSESESHDLLATNFPVLHARDAREFIAFAKTMAGARTVPRQAFALLVKLPLAVGLGDAGRMIRNILSGTRRRVDSLATETYWSRGALLWGEAGPVRYLFRPAPGAARAGAQAPHDPDFLEHELTGRLAHADVAFELCVQRYVDERRTPVEDVTVEWTEAVAPALPVALLTLPRQDLTSRDARAARERIERMTFNPWYSSDTFRPLGNINRARDAVYRASSGYRLGTLATERE